MTDNEISVPALLTHCLHLISRSRSSPAYGFIVTGEGNPYYSLTIIWALIGASPSVARLEGTSRALCKVSVVSQSSECPVVPSATGISEQAKTNFSGVGPVSVVAISAAGENAVRLDPHA